MERIKEYKDLIFSTLDSHLHSMETLMKSMKGEVEVVFDPKTNHYVMIEVHKTWASPSPRRPRHRVGTRRGHHDLQESSPQVGG